MAGAELVKRLLSKDELGPCLSTDLSSHLISKYGLSPEAARKRVSRETKGDVKRLSNLKLNNAYFMYLQKDFGAPWYWDSLYSVIHNLQGPYSRVLNALDARGIVPESEFDIVCGAPIRQKGQVTASQALKALISSDVLVTQDIPGLGKSVLTKEISEQNPKSLESHVLARRQAEILVLRGVKDWLRRLAMVSAEKVNLRGECNKATTVGTFSWDLSAPSYLSPMVSWSSNDKPKPGFVVCDILLEERLSHAHVEPFIHKTKTLRALKRVGSTLFIFVALHYEEKAFAALRSIGCMPATVENLFGKDISEGLKDLLQVIENTSNSISDPDKLDSLLSRVGRLEGVLGNIRGTFFELMTAYIVRKTAPGNVSVRKIVKDDSGKESEFDVYVQAEGQPIRLIECKALSPNSELSDDFVQEWLQKTINRARQHLKRTEALEPNGPIPKFELWVTGSIESQAMRRLQKAKDANKKKYELVVNGPHELKDIVKDDKTLSDMLDKYFLEFSYV
ncbi:hypothetical protein BZG20_15665 [Salinivibrio sp. IB868]|uniref:hypothetical protein n=1 Tax=unclassified Salinivibrio TaxID=2636825 RepID=UPI000987685D|nr:MULTISPECIES: hypothetical protein [unclassified Salinivibrio]OOE63969.1 hypothetical protein BZG20_15665 [Salinivibrio sp. IB868]OOE73123.1 hypothetical protein BZG22_11370 [Salinivibrio sp. IB870]